jgi:hypothetical protein
MRRRWATLGAVVALAFGAAACTDPGNAHDFSAYEAARAAATTTVATPAPGTETTTALPPGANELLPTTVAPPATAASLVPGAPPFMPTSQVPLALIPTIPAPPPPAPGPTAADDCSNVVPLGAFIGNQFLAPMWAAANEDMATLRQQCAALDSGTAGTVSKLWDDYVELARRAARETPYACNSNYLPCVPADPVDVACLDESAREPTILKMPVRVIGVDQYGLDADGDGFGCEPGQFPPPTG